MKILVHNYANSCSSQPMYLHECFSRVGLESSLWHPADPISVYDKLDSEKPDVLISSFNLMGKDLLAYLSENQNIKVILNITGCNQKALEDLEAVITKVYNLNCMFLLNEQHEVLDTLKSSCFNILNLPSCIDVFATKTPCPDYNLSAAIISNTRSPLFDSACEKHESYHTILLADNQDESSKEMDMIANTLNLTSIYDKYEKIVLVGDVNFTCSQVFFDSLARSRNVVVEPPEEQKELFNKVLSTLFHEEMDGYSPLDQKRDFQETIKEQAKKKHNAFSRCSTILKKMGNEEAAKVSLQISESI